METKIWSQSLTLYNLCDLKFSTHIKEDGGSDF